MSAPPTAPPQIAGGIPPDVLAAMRAHAQSNGWVASTPQSPASPQAAAPASQSAPSNIPPDVLAAMRQHAVSNHWVQAPPPQVQNPALPGYAMRPVQPSAFSPQVARWQSVANTVQQKYNIPANLTLSIIQHESDGDPGSTSNTGAKGLFQFIGSTGKDYGLVGNGYDDRTNPAKSADAFGKYFSTLLTRNNGNYTDALKQYSGYGIPNGSNDAYINGVLRMAGLGGQSVDPNIAARLNRNIAALKAGSQQPAGPSPTQAFFGSLNQQMTGQDDPTKVPLTQVPSMLAGIVPHTLESAFESNNPVSHFVAGAARAALGVPQSMSDLVDSARDATVNGAAAIGAKIASGILTPAGEALAQQVGSGKPSSQINPILRTLGMAHFNLANIADADWQAAMGGKNARGQVPETGGVIPTVKGAAMGMVQSLTDIANIPKWKADPGGQTVNALLWALPAVHGVHGDLAALRGEVLADQAANAAQQAGKPAQAQVIREAVAQAKQAHPAQEPVSPTQEPVPHAVPETSPAEALISHAKFAAADGKPVKIQSVADIENALLEHGRNTGNISPDQVQHLSSVISPIIENLARAHGQTPSEFLSGNLHDVVPGEPLEAKTADGQKVIAAANGEGAGEPTTYRAPGESTPVTASPGTQPVQPSSHLTPLSEVYRMPTKDISADPDRFQYKIGSGQNGITTTSSTQGAKAWNPTFAGVLDVWRDPEDGKTYVVNGHNRLALANRLDVPSVRVNYLDAGNAQEARAIGALKNIAEGQGTAIDAAKFFRDSKMTAQQLADTGVSMKGKIASDGRALANLHPSLFNAVVQGQLPEKIGTIIGDRLPDPSDQLVLAKQLDKAQAQGKSLDPGFVTEMADQVKNAPQTTFTTKGLFGDEESTQNLAIERADVAQFITKNLSSEGRIFAQTAKNEGRLARGNNKIDVEASHAIANESKTGLELFAQNKNLKGPVADLLNEAALRIGRGENAAKVKQDTLRQFHDLAPSLARGGENRLVEGVTADEGAPGAARGGHRGDNGDGQEALLQRAPKSSDEVKAKSANYVGGVVPQVEGYIKSGATKNDLLIKQREIDAKYAPKSVNTALGFDEHAPTAPTGSDTDTLFQKSKPQTETPEFKRWFGNSKVVDENGKPLVVYHGTPQSGFTQFGADNPDALYGPGVYLTDSPKIASGYAMPVNPDHPLANLFKQGGKGVYSPSQNDLAEYYTPGRIIKSYGGYDRVIKFNPETEKSGWSVEVRGVKDATGTPYPDHSLDGRARIHSTTPEPRELATVLSRGPGVYPVYANITNPFDMERSYTAQETNRIFGSDFAQSHKQYFKDGKAKGSDIYNAATTDEDGEDLHDYGDRRFDVTEQLKGAGYDGITHIGGSRTGNAPHQVYIAFDPTQIKSAIGNRGTFDPNDPNILHQKAPEQGSLGPEGQKGQISWSREDGKALIKLYRSADLSTASHELAHFFRRSLPPDLLAKAEAHYGITDGDWSKNDSAAEEQFARDFERYLASGKAPKPLLQDAFDRFKAWFASIYSQSKGSPIAGELHPQMKAIFDELVTGQKAAEIGEDTTRKLNKVAPSPLPASTQASKPAPPNKLGTLNLDRMDTGQDVKDWLTEHAKQHPDTFEGKPIPWKQTLAEAKSLGVRAQDLQRGKPSGVTISQWAGAIRDLMNKASREVKDAEAEYEKHPTDQNRAAADAARNKADVIIKAGLHGPEGSAEIARALNIHKAFSSAARATESGAIQDLYKDAPRTPAKSFGTANKLFSEDRASLARQRILSQVKEPPKVLMQSDALYQSQPPGKIELNPQNMKDLTEVGGYYLEGGLRNAEDWKAQMNKDFGGSLSEGDLQRIWNNVKLEAAQRQGAARVSRTDSATLMDKLSRGTLGRQGTADFLSRIAKDDYTTPEFDKLAAGQPLTDQEKATLRNALAGALNTARRTQGVRIPNQMNLTELQDLSRSARIQAKAERAVTKTPDELKEETQNRLAKGLSDEDRAEMRKELKALDPHDTRGFVRVMNKYNRMTFGESAAGLVKAGFLSHVALLPKIEMAHAAFNLAEELKRPIAAVSDLAYSATHGTDRQVPGLSVAAMSRAAKIAATKGVAQSIRLLKEGEAGLALTGESQHIMKGVDVPSEYNANLGNSALNKLANHYVNGVGRLHGAVYHVNKVYGFERALDEQAQLAAMHEAKAGQDYKERYQYYRDNPTTMMIVNAANAADELVFQNANRIHSSIESGKRALGPYRPAADVVLPFTKVRSNVFLKGLEYATGLPTGICQLIKRDLIDKNVMDEAQQKAWANTMGRGTIGAAAIGLGAYLAKHKMMQPSDPQHFKPAMILVNGKGYPVSDKAPVGAWLAAGGSLASRNKENAILDLASEAPVVDSSNNIATAMQNPAGEVGSEIKGIAVPGVVQDIAGHLDTQKRQTTFKGQPIKTIEANIMSGVPYARQRLPSKGPRDYDPLDPLRTRLHPRSILGGKL